MPMSKTDLKAMKTASLLRSLAWVAVFAGVAVASLGHAHPGYIAAVEAQHAALVHELAEAAGQWLAVGAEDHRHVAVQRQLRAQGAQDVLALGAGVGRQGQRDGAR